MKAIIIARVSTEEQRDAGNSLPAQLARLERYCQNKGYQIVQTCSFDESAYTNDRSEFDRIIDLILAQTEKVVVCCDKVDRLSRNVFDKRISILYERALNDKIELHFISDGQTITSSISAVEKFQFSISLGLAKYYSDAISDNVRRAMEQKLRKGEWLSKAPYGYKNVKTDKGASDVIIQEYEACLVRKLFELYASGAYSIDLLRAKLKKEYDITWSRANIGKMLNNPFYHGVMIVKGKEYPHRYPPILPRTLFEQVQVFKATFFKKPYRYKGKAGIFYRGLIRCGDCGLAITAEEHKGNVYYHCTQYRGKHDAAWLREEIITDQLSAVFKKLQLPKNIVQEITTTLTEVHENKVDFHNKQMEKLAREQKSVSLMKENLYMDKLKGRITESEYDKFYTMFKEQLSDIDIRIDQLREAEENYYATANAVLKITTQAYDIFKSSIVEERRHLIKLVLSNLRIEKENLVWDVHTPFNEVLKANDCQVWRG